MIPNLKTGCFLIFRCLAKAIFDTHAAGHESDAAMRFVPISLVVLGAISCAACEGSGSASAAEKIGKPGEGEVGSPNVANRAIDGNIAIKAELDAAIASGDPKRIELFIARHPKHPLAPVARAELSKMRGGE
jgi:hypothetical protein